MARLPRLAAAGYPHHVIQRGNNRQPIFVDAADFEQCLKELRDQSQRHQVAIHAYVLMPNHLHLLATPENAEGLSRLMQGLGRAYVRWFNRRHERTGTLWEGRFRSTVVQSDRYLLACARYIELNPVRAELVADPADYPWSSFRHHIGTRTDPLVREHPLIWALGNTPFDRQAAYQRLFDVPLAPAELERIRTDTQRGWVLGDPGFAAELSVQTQRRTQPLSRGRPPKPKTD